MDALYGLDEGKVKKFLLNDNRTVGKVKNFSHNDSRTVEASNEFF